MRVVFLTILASAGVAAFEAVDRLLHPRPVTHLGAIIFASIMIADGYHARTDGWTSLAVLFGAVGVYYGYPKADPIVGLLITVAILVIVWQSARTVLGRMIDGVDAGVIDQIEHAAGHVSGVAKVTDARARWIGHRMRAEVSVAVDPDLSVAQGHRIAREVEHELRHELAFLSSSIVHVDPVSEAGEAYHRDAHDEEQHDHGAASHPAHSREEQSGQGDDHGHSHAH